MRILVDFDHTTCDSDNVQPGHRMGPPEPGAISSLRRLALTNEVIIFTGRRVDIPSVHEAVRKWLDFFQIPYHGITNVKPERYDLIIDDKAMHFDEWPKVMSRLTMRERASINTDVEENKYSKIQTKRKDEKQHGRNRQHAGNDPRATRT